jgi:TetR/AcrR family transcriptional repressor of nem operon
MARPREFDEERVLAAARDAFSSTGFAGTSVEDLSAATGLGKGSMYGAFGGKRDLFLRVFDDYCESSVNGAKKALDGPPEGALSRVAAYLQRSADKTAADTRRRGCLLAKGTAELAEHDPVVAKRSKRTIQLIEDQITAALTFAQEQGDATDAASARALARTVLAAVRGMEAVGKAGMGPEGIHDIAATTIALLSAPARSPRQAATHRARPA